MIKIEQGKPEDIPGAMALIRELALYEKAPQEVTATEETMLQDGFGERPYFEFFVAKDAGKIIGLALYYFNYSTWKGKALYLEDLVVTEKRRQEGIGKLLFDRVVKKAQQAEAKRMAWQVLDWNEPAINFYKKINANLDGDWINCKLTASQLANYK